MVLEDKARDARAAAERGVSELVRWAATLRFDDIPENARLRMALIIADDVAAILSAQDEPEVKAVHEHLVGSSLAKEATLLRRSGPRVDCRAAALGNGLAASWNEMDEGYRRAPCHAGIYSLPALFATAETVHLPVREVIRSGIGAYEIVARFARTWRSIIPPVHPHGMFNSVGAAAAAGLARGLDAKRLMLALTGAVTMVSPGPYDHAIRGALVRNAWAAAGAEIGMLCVDWALAGIGGVASSPYDVYARCFGADTDGGQLTEDLGAEWAVCDGYHKMHACCQYAHSSLDALSEILSRREDLIGGERVASIRVETHPLGLTLDNYDPATTLAAKFSLPHAVASALVHGGAGVEAFASSSLSDARVARLRRAVELKPHPQVRPWPLDRPGRVTLTLGDGETISADCASARGGPDRPFSEEEIRAKIEALAAPTAPGLARAHAWLAQALQNGGAALEFAWASWMSSLFEEEIE